jgi:hypothetical protein
VKGEVVVMPGCCNLEEVVALVGDSYRLYYYVGGGEVTYGGAITGATKLILGGNREAKLEAKFSL